MFDWLVRNLYVRKFKLFNSKKDYEYKYSEINEMNFNLFKY